MVSNLKSLFYRLFPNFASIIAKLCKLINMKIKIERWQVIVLILAVALLSANFSHAQELEDVDGFYYKKGMLYTGTHTEYYENGNVKIEMNIKNGLKDGTVTTYFEDGSTKEKSSYKEGLKHGEWVDWNASGTKIALAYFLNDKKDGDWFVWNDKGFLLYEMHYKKGKKVGEWKMYDDDGKLKDVRKY